MGGGNSVEKDIKMLREMIEKILDRADLKRRRKVLFLLMTIVNKLRRQTSEIAGG